MFSNDDSQTKWVINTLFSKNVTMTKINKIYITPNGLYTKVGSSLIGPDGRVWSNIKDESEIDAVMIHENKKQSGDD